MARASTRTSKRDPNRTRVDPPNTMIDPNIQVLLLERPDGRPLDCDQYGHHDERFQYAWVDHHSQTQYAQYQGLQYVPCKVGEDCARPVADVFMADGVNPKPGALIERAGMMLMKRPIEVSHQTVAWGKQRTDDRLEQMGQLDRELDRQARHSDMRVQPANYDRE